MISFPCLLHTASTTKFTALHDEQVSSTRVPKQYYGNEVCLWYSDEKVDMDFARIMAVSSVMIGIDQETYESAPYKEQFFVAFG